MIFSKVKKRERKAKKLLRLVGLGRRMNHYPSQLSGGEAQRVAIARALANDPEILLADEPTGNLDTKSGNEIIKLLLKLNRKYGLTLVIVTHDIFIAKNAKRVIYLRDGKIIKEKRT
jgi:putative ABC transport system ATP-binding protein